MFFNLSKNRKKHILYKKIFDDPVFRTILTLLTNLMTHATRIA